ncbi:ABC transporter substrate-binding protein [Paenibacillus humicola]|uniref:ABC transporter substrate-binding protein n=1 Tax=Paenibacillus humicola TaxID=3110540 RepID=UPI00237A1901|nr:ABC transporter substrate-binding protein [Paenibacillus humicola]
MMRKKRNQPLWAKRWPALLLAALLLTALAACGGPKNADQAQQPAANGSGGGTTNTQVAGNAADDTTADGGNAGGDKVDAGSAGAPQATVYPLKVTDGTGTELTFQQAPQRIVTLLPSETEVVYAVGAGDRVVAVDDFSNYPKDAESKEKIGGADANLEKIASLKPDLVLGSSNMSSNTVEALRKLNLTVYASDPKTYDAVIDKIKQIGVILDKSAEAEKVATHMQDVRKQVEEAVKDAPKPKVYLEISPGWTVGKGEFLDELLTIAGGTNIADQSGWFQIDPEAVIKANPDIIVYTSQAGLKPGEKNPILAAIETRPGWEQISAVKNNKLFEVDQDPLVRVGPRLSDGLLEVAKKLHPDLVK